MNEAFVDLHQHGTFSLLDAYGLPEQIVSRAKELGRIALAITDHGSMSAHPMMEKACIGAGIKFIPGEEFYVVSDLDVMRAENIQRKSHLTVLAKNQKGYRNLIKLASESYRLGFYYRPTIDSKLLMEYGEGLVILSGCTLSPTSKLILDDDVAAAEAAIRKMWQAWGNDFLLEVQPTDFVDCQRVNTELKRIAKAYGIPIVVTNDVHYPVQGQHDVRRILHSVRDRKRFEEVDDMLETHYQLSYEELVSLSKLGLIDDVIHEAAQQTLRIADDCNVKLEKASLLQFPLPEGAGSKNEYLKQLILEGMKMRGIVDVPEYRDRANYEYRLILEKEFADYFLIIADMVQWAKANNILVGPARGSAAGSLICYALRITEVDPLKWGLLFERFIDITRLDLPDIDLDFEDERRHLVKEYLREKYGADRVATLATFMTFKGKNSLDEIGKSFGVPAGEVATVKNLLIERSSADARAGFTIEDTFTTFDAAKQVVDRWPQLRNAGKLEGQYKTIGTHAAGVVISNVSLDKNVPIYWRKNEYDQLEAFAGYDYDGCSYMGLVKVDILGLTALTRLHAMMEYVGMSFDDLYNLPLDDEQTLDGFRRGDLLGIFQYEGDATRSIIQQMTGVKNINELVDVNAMSRPGPLHSGNTTKYINNRDRDDAAKERLNPLLDVYTKDTQYQILYQEQVLRICREVGDLSWKDTSDLRKAMSRSLGDEFFSQYRERFAQGAMDKHGVSRQEGMAIYDMMETFGSWAFNLAHSVSYALIGYWTMWWKVHHPHLFYWSMIDHEGDEDKQRQYLMEYVRRGGKVSGPNINEAKQRWSLSERTGGIVAGFLAIKGIGDKCADAIVAAQPYKDIADFEERVNKKTVNKAKRELLVTAGCFSDTPTEDFMGLQAEIATFNSVQRTHRIIDLDFGPKIQGVQVVGRLKRRNLRNLFEANSVAKRMRWNPETQQNEPAPVKDEQLADWVVLTVEDESGVVFAVVDRWRYPSMQKQVWNKLQEGMLIRITGDKPAGFKRLAVKKIEQVM